MVPNLSQGSGTTVRRTREIEYMDHLPGESSRWIHTHPAEFDSLCPSHLRRIFPPDDWQFLIGSGRLMAVAHSTSKYFTGSIIPKFSLEIGQMKSCDLARGRGIYRCCAALLSNAPNRGAILMLLLRAYYSY